MPLSALDPGKQGLKQCNRPEATGQDPLLSALDPGKQGLKQPIPAPGHHPLEVFQRLIQENKD